MYYELALISVAIGGGYWGWHFVRQETLRGYGALNLIAAILALLGFFGQRNDDDRFGIPGAIGVGAGACLLVLGPMARGFARRAAATERFGLAHRLLDVAEVLAPGSGVGEEKQLLAAMREIRDGNIEQTVDALETAKRSASPEARHAIDERIAMLYLASYRWDEAIAHAEAHLFNAVPPAAETPSSPGIALRRALGLAPPVWVELLGAYGYKGDLDQAARMLARLEEVCADRPDAGIWVHRGRMMFLALAGRVAAVSRLVEPKRSPHMKPAARTYWIAVAHERSGEVAEAEAAYAKARARSRGRPRVLIDQALARMASGKKPADLGAIATEIVTRVEGAPVPEISDAIRQRGPYTAKILLVSMVAVAIVVSLLLGPSSDVGVLVRDGALVRGLVHEGEWWRLVTSIFVHVGGVHLIVNLIGLWFLGRLAEDLFGGWRTFAIFALSGLAGAVASFLATPAGISAGASGGLFGLLGAVFCELTVHRKQHRVAWTRGVWGSLAVVTVAQVAIGFLYPVTDQWAHGGGLVMGALAGLACSPHLRRGQRAVLVGAKVVSAAFALGTIGSFVLVGLTPLETSLTRSPLVQRATTAITAEVPASWQRQQDELFDPDVYMVLLAQRVEARGTLEEQLSALVDGERARAKDKEFDRIDVVTPIVAMPEDWKTIELIVSIEDALGSRQRFRVVIGARPDGDAVMFASLYAPETIMRAMPQYFAQILRSVRAR